MNKINLLKKRNQIRQLIEMSNRNRNVLKWSSNEKWTHIIMKLKICHWLKQQNKEFYSEAILVKGRLRCDIINADDGVIYEVVASEKSKSIEKKKKVYPLPIIVVDANQEWKEELIL